MTERCYKSHKPLKIGKFEIHGGSCSDPVDELDMYIGLDHMMPTWEESWPWTDGISFCYPITDYQAPKNPESFKKLIDCIEEHLKDGWRVHVGCMGGHGRTGTVFAALVAQMLGKEDAITYVRKHYCEKVVESRAQINFLHKHFGIKKVEESKRYTFPKKGKASLPSGSTYSFSDFEHEFHDSYTQKREKVNARLDEAFGQVTSSTKKIVVKPRNSVGRIILDK